MPDRKFDYEKVKKFNLFRETPDPGSNQPQYRNNKVFFEVALEPGRYAFAGWKYEDTGNISVEIQRVTEIEQERIEPGDSFDD